VNYIQLKQILVRTLVFLPPFSATQVSRALLSKLRIIINIFPSYILNTHTAYLCMLNYNMALDNTIPKYGVVLRLTFSKLHIIS